MVKNFLCWSILEKIRDTARWHTKIEFPKCANMPRGNMFLIGWRFFKNLEAIQMWLEFHTKKKNPKNTQAGFQIE